jgi:hypothetical protein
LLLALVCVATFSNAPRLDLADARKPTRLSAPEFVEAANALPDPSECGLLANELRPFLIHRPLAPSEDLPLTVEAFDEAARGHGPICIVYVRTSIPNSVLRRGPKQRALIGALKRADRLRDLRHTPVVDVYRLVR